MRYYTRDNPYPPYDDLDVKTVLTALGIPVAVAAEG